MESDKLKLIRTQHVYDYLLKSFVEENHKEFSGMYLHNIYEKILSDKLILHQFIIFLKQKLYLLTYTTLEKEKINESFLGDLN